jgi:cyclomaltodextrinase
MWQALYIILITLSCTQAGLAETRIPVSFRFVPDKPAERVYLAGTFNQWQFRENPMNTTDDGRTWTLTLLLSPGAHQYKFVVNGTDWRTDPNALQNVDDGFGNVNSVLWVEPNGYNRPAVLNDGHITRSAVLHRPNDLRDCNPIGKQLYLSLRTRRDDVMKVELVSELGVRGSEFGRFFNPHSAARSPYSALRMPHSADDSLFAYYQITLPNKAFRYVFKLTDGNSVLWLSPSGLSENRPTSRFEYKPPKQPFIVPNWVQDAVFYQIMPDRFHNGDPKNDPPTDKPIDYTGRTDEFFGGDLIGTCEKLDYLQSLGITTLYLNPIFASVTHHKYDTDDYEQVDPSFGGDQAFIQLQGGLQKRKMNVVLDGVFNHAGILFFAFQDLIKNQENSAYKNWFYVERFPVKVKNPPDYWGWWGIEYMPKLNHNTPAVREYLRKAVTDWMKRVPLGGWRLDVANEVPDTFWREFRKDVKKRNPQAVIIGEIWDDAGHWLQGDMFDSVMNYPWRGAVLDFTAHRRITPSQFDSRMQVLHLRYPRQVLYALYNMLSSHDTPRLRRECGGDLDRVRLAFMLQMTAIGAPAIYYGDEIGMDGGGTPDNRRPMNWNLNEEEQALFAYVQSLIRARKSIPALRRGDWRTLLTDDKQGVYAYARAVSNSNPALIIINNGSSPAEVNLPVPFNKVKEFEICVHSRMTQPAGVYRVFDGYLHLSIPAMTGVILVPKGIQIQNNKTTGG